jgi:hypothetical protein
MKLRIHGNALRLRLTRSEVDRFAEQGRIEDAIEFAPNVRFTYSLERSTDARSPQAIYRDGALRVQIPRAEADDWVGTDRVGISGGDRISIAVEKDFKCMHDERAEDADAYPNPLEAAAKME